MYPFTKLKIKTNIVDCYYGAEDSAYGDHRSIEFFKISNTLEDQLFNIIPIEYRKYFFCTIMKINANYIRPHTDSDRTVGINFYVDPGNAMTVFYNKKEDTADIMKVVGQTNGSVYNENDVIPFATFKAEIGDIWILDVTQIHGVYSLSNKQRIAYNISSNTLSYSDTLEILNHLLQPNISQLW
jgi:hypothetical protein